MSYNAVLFDLDGTLLDTLDDLGDSMNAVLARRGLPTHPIEAYKTFVGNGVRALVQRAAGQLVGKTSDLEAMVGEMRVEYAERWDKKTRPYDGIIEMLTSLVARGARLAILSNKPDDFTKLCVQRFLGDMPWEIIQGVDSCYPPKPDPLGAKSIAEKMELNAEQFLYLGDTNTDMETANAAGMYAVGVTWGFRTSEELKEYGAKTLIDHPRELFDLF